MDEIVENPPAYLGQVVTVRATVDDCLPSFPGLFLLEDDDLFFSEQLVVVRPSPEILDRELARFGGLGAPGVTDLDRYFQQFGGYGLTGRCGGVLGEPGLGAMLAPGEVGAQGFAEGDVVTVTGVVRLLEVPGAGRELNLRRDEDILTFFNGAPAMVALQVSPATTGVAPLTAGVGAQAGGGEIGFADRAAAAAAAPVVAAVQDPSGNVLGVARFVPVAGGVRVLGTFRGLDPGLHAFHIHAVGACVPPGFQSAGGHFNPTNREHGFLNPYGHHLGDLPNLEVGPLGVGSIDALAEGTTLFSGPTALLDADGSALVIHARPDDLATSPAGNAGDRVACGVLVPAR